MCLSLQNSLRCVLSPLKRINNESNQNYIIIYCVHKRHMNVTPRVTNHNHSDLLWYRSLAEKDYLYAQRRALLA